MKFDNFWQKWYFFKIFILKVVSLSFIFWFVIFDENKNAKIWINKIFEYSECALFIFIFKPLSFSEGSRVATSDL